VGARAIGGHCGWVGEAGGGCKRWWEGDREREREMGGIEHQHTVSHYLACNVAGKYSEKNV